MLLHLIRNQPQGSAIAGRLVINGRWFCNTLERVGYQIPALCYPVRVTQSPKFKRLLPLVCNVPRLPIADSEASNRAKPVQYPAAECRTGIRFHRGTQPSHSTGCILVLGDASANVGRAQKLSELSSNPNPSARTTAEVENQLTQLLLKNQSYEEIILEVTDFRPGTPLGYDTPCPAELQKP